jgi:pyruvate,water dikinase
MDLTRGYADKTEFFVDRLAPGLAPCGGLLPETGDRADGDFETNEYANLIGGAFNCEKRPDARSVAPPLLPRAIGGLALECRAIRRLREEMGSRMSWS